MSAEEEGGAASSSPLAILKRTFSEFIEDDCPRLAAALSYYTVFSLPPILVLLLLIAGAFMDPDAVRERITNEFGTFLGPDAAAQVQTMIQSAQDTPNSWLATILSIGALLFSATGALSQLQRALNKAWGVEFSPRAEGVKKVAFVIGKRLFSLAMVVVIAFLLFVSFTLSALIRTFADQLEEFLPGFADGTIMIAANMVLQFMMFTLLFAAMFKILPDARLKWRTVLVGASVTALLFMVGLQLISIYLGQSDPGSAFGTAGALAVILVWVYLSAIILFLGAEFTQVWVQRGGRRIEPSKYAVRVRTETVRSEEAGYR